MWEQKRMGRIKFAAREKRIRPRKGSGRTEERIKQSKRL